MEDKIKDRMILLSNKILNSSRNELYLSMRFLDIALSSLPYELYLSTVTIGTDGEKILYNPNYLLRRYQDDPVLINRTYLHMLLHCIFRHMIKEEERDLEYWNLSCDIAVESIIDSLDYKCIKLTVSDTRNEIYDMLHNELKVLTAEGIYYVLMKKNLSYGDLGQMEKEFVACDHAIWNRLKKSANEEENQGSDKNIGQEENQEESEKENQGESEKENQEENEEENQEENKEENKESSKKEKSQVDKEQEEKIDKTWKDVSEKVQANIEAMSRQIGDEAGGLMKALNIENREKYDYKDFLRKFAVSREEIQVDMDSYDYVFYTYGLSMYGNMPFVEPLEYKEMTRIEEFVIVIDTSGSCSVDLIKKFLEESYSILTSGQTFTKKINIFIIQCDNQVQSADKITSEDDLKKYMNDFEIKGLGGTDFRPAFRYIDKLIEEKEFHKLKGILYFTDGYGIYPTKRPNYDVAFVFLEENYTDVSVPSWAMKLIIESGGL